MTLVDELRVTLSDVITLNHRIQGFHWNVTGPDFAQYHELFAEIYEDVDGSVDPLAENIRKIGGLSPFRLIEFAQMRTLKETDIDSTAPADMVRDLLSANDLVIAQIGRAFEAATAENEQGIANFLAERDDMHKKWRWQLRASLGMV
jgi:starvation-inducible DNA-binding protein